MNSHAGWRAAGVFCVLAVCAGLPSAASRPLQDTADPKQEPAEAPAAPERPPRIAEGHARVTAEIEAIELEAHVAYLAEYCEGRRTGSEGEQRAGEYLAMRLAEAGLLPAGDLGPEGKPTYFQDVHLVRRFLEGEPVLELLGEGENRLLLTPDEHFRVESVAPLEGEFDLGSATSLTPLEGVVPDAILTTDSHPRTRNWLSRQAAGSRPRLVVCAGGGRGQTREPRLERESQLSTTAIVSLQRDVLSRVVAGEFQRARLVVRARTETLIARNVVAHLPAAPSAEVEAQAPQAIVLSAHYDHLGTREPRQGEPEGADLVFDGADDDASGVAAVLELAEALALGPAPKREVVVLLATAEEVGLLGTYHYLDNPVVPLDRTALNLNFEMLGRPDPMLGAGRLWLTGFERTNLGPTLLEKGLDIAVDPRPEENFFQRSDNYAFARLGIPAQTLSSFGKHRDYHRESDAWWTLDYEHMATALEPALEIVRLAASGELSPEWLPGGKPEPR